MKTNRIGMIVALVVGLGALGAFGLANLLAHQRIPEPTADSQSKNWKDPDLIKRGAYLSRLADCKGCHTVNEAAPYVGGRAFPTPVGAIYATNITPDRKTGIGDYTFEEFDAAVRWGVRKDGAVLYPAMPYPAYVIMPREDIEALYAYFMNDVEPIERPNPKSTIPPVLNWRWPLAYWQLLFSGDRNFEPNPALDDEQNRGAYLVEGPGHCGACHTPRGLALQELAMNLADGDHYLSGAAIEGWRAKSLRGESRGLGSWSEKEIEEFLQTGRNDKTAAFGSMSYVVEHSTAHLTREDNRAMARYLKSLSPVPGEEDEPEVPVGDRRLATDGLLTGEATSRGAALYAEYCQTCHRHDGLGIPRVFPALAGNTIVRTRHPESLIQVTLDGSKMASTPADIMTFIMPGYSNLSDADIAEILTFIRNSWGNVASPINPSQVSEIRHFLKHKPAHVGVHLAAKGGVK